MTKTQKIFREGLWLYKFLDVSVFKKGLLDKLAKYADIISGSTTVMS